MLTRFVALLFVVGVLAAACGGSSDEASSTQSPADASPSELDVSGSFDQVATADGLMTLASEDPVAASLAFLSAADRGYDPLTVFEAINAARFNLDGVVVTADGGIVEPEGSDGGVIFDKPPLPLEGEAFGSIGAVLVDLPSGGVTIAELAGDLELDIAEADVGHGPGAAPPPEDRPETWVELDEQQVLGRYYIARIGNLAASGYSAEQIIEAIVLGVPLKCTDTRNELTRELYTNCTLDGEEPELDRLGLVAAADDTIPAEEPASEDDNDEGNGDEAVPTEGVWMSDVAYNDDTVPFELLTSEATITRAAGSDEFTIFSTITYRTSPPNCSFDWFKSFVGTGFLNDAGTQIQFDGTQTVQNTSTCPDANLQNATAETRYTVAVDGSTITGYIGIGDISASGPPVVD